MEDRPYDPNNPEDSPIEHVEKKERHGNFLSQFLAKRFGEKPNGLETDEDDDDEESLDKKPRRWHSKFKNFFKNVVPPPENESEAPKNPPAAELFAWPFTKDVIVEKDSKDALPGVENVSVQETVVNDHPTPAAETESPLSTPSYEQSTVQAQEVQDIRSEQESTELVGESRDTDEIQQTDNLETPETSLDTPTAPEETIIQPSESYQGELTIPHEHIIRHKAETQPAVEKETVVERGVGSALPVALVAAEYIGRKRADRKITETFAKKTDNLEKNAVEARRAHEQLDQLLRQNREQLASLKQERGIDYNSTAETPQMPAPQNSPERFTPESQQEIPRLQPDALQVTPATEQVKTAEVKEQKEPKPQQIMEQVAQAAEHDVPVERVFERSHEVKDDTATTPTAGAASVGSIMSVSQRNRQQSSQAFSKDYQKQATASSFSNNLPFLNDQTPEMYKQAMKAGFTAAIAIIVFGFLAYLMIK